MTRRRPASVATTPRIALRSSSVPEVSTIGVNECPAPATRTPPRASRTARTTSASSRACTTAAGENDWFPTQLVQGMRGFYRIGGVVVRTTNVNGGWLGVPGARANVNGGWVGRLGCRRR